MADEQHSASTADIHQEIETLKSDLRKLQSDLRDVTNTMWSMGRQSYQQTSDELHERVESSMQQVQDYMQRQPFTTVAVCFVSGFVLGKLFSRR